MSVEATLQRIVESIDIPDSAYEVAASRYHDVGDWLGRAGSHCHNYSPHIYPQGSFRLGTVVKPINDGDDYDLDLGCRLKHGLTKLNTTQKQLKHLVGRDLELYREARNIKSPLEEKHRCWSLQYADALSFHLDVVPSIPTSSQDQQLMLAALLGAGLDRSLASRITGFGGSITDNRQENYDRIDLDWRQSNSEGYALWFESRTKLAAATVVARAASARVATIDELPAYKWRVPLQRVVQLLKRHRDIMFLGRSDEQPISIIITTLAGRAYDGSTDLASALRTVLADMGRLVGQTRPRVPNPVNPAEDFADKWDTPKGRALRLEYHFREWLAKATADFSALEAANSDVTAIGRANAVFGTRIGTTQDSLLRPAAVAGSGLSFPPKPVVPSKPAGFASLP